MALPSPRAASGGAEYPTWNDDGWWSAYRRHFEAELQAATRHRRPPQSRGRVAKCFPKDLIRASEVQKLEGQQVAPCPLRERRRRVGGPASAGKLSATATAP